MKKIIRWVVLVVTILLIFLFWPYFFAYEALSKKVHYSDDPTLFAFYSHFYSKEKYNRLLRTLITDQKNLNVLVVLAEYSKQNKKCELLPDLIESMSHYKNLLRDSAWIVPITNRYEIEFSTDLLYDQGSYFDDVNLLKEICDSTKARSN